MEMQENIFTIGEIHFAKVMNAILKVFGLLWGGSCEKSVIYLYFQPNLNLLFYLFRNVFLEKDEFLLSIYL
ncbi:hypothetical protein JFL43_00645 [Viridibacillus sp. YIM B01967]|uniref:Uncharacterized protein n=1 Tax=Viridibacillus soli TaxID=2798301 RepID=A0ABS1H1V7_9BACL|nr:hypothetical protein [Viridibacillus soli]MBK3493400.1 hypothetical protein [Viridibacillus soli]